MSQYLVRAAIEKRLKNWADSKGLPVAWEDVPFDPPEVDPNDPESGCYLVFNMLPAETGSEDFVGAHRRYNGVAQIGIVVPSGRGPRQADRLLAELDALFPCSLRINEGSIEVMVLTPVSPGPAISDEKERFLPVSFRYRADVI